MLFQSMLPRPTESSDDAFLASMTLHLATVPVPIGGGCCELKSSPYIGTLPFRTWPCAAAGRNQAGISQLTVETKHPDAPDVGGICWLGMLDIGDVAYVGMSVCRRF